MRYGGTIQTGLSRARALGFPTINISLPDSQISGIFVACVYIDGKKYPAAAFADPTRKILEAHLVDFVGEVNGNVTIELVKKIRESKKFTSNEELKVAIAADVETVKNYFSILQNSKTD